MVAMASQLVNSIADKNKRLNNEIFLIMLIFFNLITKLSPVHHFCGNLATRKIKFIMKSFFKRKGNRTIEASLHLNTFIKYCGFFKRYSCKQFKICKLFNCG